MKEQQAAGSRKGDERLKGLRIMKPARHTVKRPPNTLTACPNGRLSKFTVYQSAASFPLRFTQHLTKKHGPILNLHQIDGWPVC